MADLRRIAMWSGPRNISTAMMRAWENRADTVVVDEPLYAFYLHATGKAHPMAGEVIAAGETDWRKVADGLVGNLSPAGRQDPSHLEVFYQKQMTHHLLPEVKRDWLASLTNCFLIRDPAEVIVSYLKKNENPSAEDLGFPQQAEIFEFVCARSGLVPPVIDARDVLQNPEHIMRRLCETLGIEFDPAMLSWPAGLRESDGVWAKYWYGEVKTSTGFAPYRVRCAEVPPRFKDVEARCRESYELLRAHCLR